jgi:hypothetical protein
MKLSDLKNVLSENTPRNIRFMLPTQTKTPPHAHVTEVARIEKRFIDCGGTMRLTTACHLQVWFKDDTDHRLTAGKLLAILEKSASFLVSDDLEVEVEYEAPFVSIFPLEGVEVSDDSFILRLGVKHTECLAEDRCLPPNLAKPIAFSPLPQVSKSKCC